MIVAPELVKHRSANPRHRVGTEGETSRWLVARGGLKEAHCAGADQLIEVDLVMQSAGELARDMVNEADVLLGERSYGLTTIGTGSDLGGGIHRGSS